MCKLKRFYCNLNYVCKHYDGRFCRQASSTKAFFSCCLTRKMSFNDNVIGGNDIRACEKVKTLLRSSAASALHVTYTNCAHFGYVFANHSRKCT